MLSWANRFNICCFLDNQQYRLPHHSEECLVGVGVLKHFEPAEDFLYSLSSFCSAAADYIFGHFSYDCKNYLEPLTSSHPDGIGFPDAFLFVPQVVLRLHQQQLQIGVTIDDAATIFKEILEEEFPIKALPAVKLLPRIEHAAYLAIIEQLKQHIKRGDCYEINFCQEFYSHHVVLDPVQVYQRLQEVSPNPFSAYYRVNDKYLACASPERYVRKEGKRIISQPIKGTAPRNHEDKTADDANKQRLLSTQKERSENVMIVDLVRNDLAKICTQGSVKVEELLGLYSFPNVHQMISTISGTLPPSVGIAEVLAATFPMGSMTGAPKRRVLELVEQYEKTKRGIFSGTVGYISPAGDFDFNVVIRSIMYNSSSKYLSYQVGGGITYLSDPQQEYEECLLKAQAIEKVLSEK
nr:anthranilate synthase component I family protein [Aridibaculum aurantiacum]